MDKLYVHIVKRSETAFDVVGLSSDKITWYTVPDQFKDLGRHEVLSSLTTIVRNCESISRVNGFRKVCLKFSDELKLMYLDEDDNFCLNSEIYLEEYMDGENVKNVSLNDSTTSDSVYLIKRIKDLENKLMSRSEMSLSELQRKMMIDKFEQKCDAAEWITTFEKECLRLEIKEGFRMIELLRLFIDDKVKEWYFFKFIKVVFVRLVSMERFIFTNLR